MLHANQSLKTWGKLKQESSHVYSLIFLIYSSYFLFHMCKRSYIKHKARGLFERKIWKILFEVWRFAWYN